MRATVRSSPLYNDTFALCGAVLEDMERGGGHGVLRARISRGAIRLLDAVTLAVEGMDRHDRLLDADAELRTLRTHLQLARQLGVLDDEVRLALAEQTEGIGRQIGGWLRKLESVS